MLAHIARQGGCLALALALLIAGCAESHTATPAQPDGSNAETPTIISTATPSPTPTPHLLATAAAIYELTATTRAKTPFAIPTSTLPPRVFLTSTPTLTATITATFDYSRFITNTPAPAARCPQVQEGAIVTPEFYNPKAIFKPKAEDILKYLNTYGPNSLISFYQQEREDYWNNPIEGYADYTNDGVRELAFGDGFFNIFGCQNGKYVLLYQHEADAYLLAPDIILVQDANRNGVPEITLITNRMTQGGHSYLGIEWDGSQFRDVFPYRGALGGARLESEDIDHDGYTEYVVYEGSGVMDSYRFTIPWREEKTYFRWNGGEFAMYKEVFAPSEYRFQAVEDGDRALLYGEMSKALDFYRQVIYSDTLGWWSLDRERFFEEVYWNTWSNDSPTPVPPVPDPDEYDNLAAYARFKLMVAYAAQGWQADAKLMYDHLQRLYPQGKAGQAYAEMASVFWSQYEKSQDLAGGCQAAIQYASSHPDAVYYYLTGGNGYQVNRIKYSRKTQYLCPFQ